MLPSLLPFVCSAGGREQPPLPATAQVAFQQADYVAWNLWAAINNKPLLSFRWAEPGGGCGGAGVAGLNAPAGQPCRLPCHP